jgi:hypothetical protein
MLLRVFQSAVSQVIALTLACPAGLVSADGQLRITVVEGDNAINNIRERTARAPVVRVEDEAGRPIAGAAVTFVVSDLGAGGDFDGHGGTLTVVTDKDGRATGRGLRPNKIAGPFEIRVIASQGNRKTSAVVRQINAAPADRGSSAARKALLIVGVAAGAVLGASFALGGDDSAGVTAPAGSSPGPGSSRTVIAPGSPIFGPPR